MFQTSTVNMKSAEINILHICNAVTLHNAANSQSKDGTWRFWTYTAVKANMMHILHIHIHTWIHIKSKHWPFHVLLSPEVWMHLEAWHLTVIKQERETQAL